MLRWKNISSEFVRVTASAAWRFTVMLQQGCSPHTLGRRRPASRAGGGFPICRRGPLNGMTLAHKAVSSLPLPPRPGSGNRIVSPTPGAYKLMSGHQMFLGVIDSSLILSSCLYLLAFRGTRVGRPNGLRLLHIILDRVARQWRQL